ncbi:MAG: VanW family protein [Candidatus Uhrbacteria bacterium]
MEQEPTTREQPSKLTHHLSHTLAWSLAGGLAILLLGAIGVGAITYDHAYTDRIFPGTSVGTIDVGGFTKQEATERVQKVLDAYLGQGFSFALDGRTVTIDAIVMAPSDPDLWYPLVSVDVPSHIEAAFSMGRSDSISSQWSERLRGALRSGARVPIQATVHTELIATALEENYPDAFTTMSPPRVRVSDDDPTSWTIEPGIAGHGVENRTLEELIRYRVATLDPAPIAIAATTIPPPFDDATAAAAIPLLERARDRAPITITHNNHRWTIEPEHLAIWLAIDDAAQPILDRDLLTAWVDTTISTSIETPARNAQLSFHPTTKRVTSFTPSREGIAVNRDLLFSQINATVFGSLPPLIELPVERTPPDIALRDTNDLGISELLGTGRTNYGASPANRIHNIKTGSKLLNGVLIPPGEEFSTINTLTPFDETNGYKAELVIKGNRTIPEFGGGLCQVSSTLFRAALYAGLPITERSPHAYRVGYYEPPVGMDATIYNPQPDLRFLNDTNHHLLLVTRVDGTEPVYEIWGTSDGRSTTLTEPEVYNYVEPAETKYVETLDIPPGETKCVERAHTGADAKFTRTITQADGQITKTEFKSHYRPWQAVCLVGVEKLSEDVDAAEAAESADAESTTDSTSPPATNTPPLMSTLPPTLPE